VIGFHGAKRAAAEAFREQIRPNDREFPDKPNTGVAEHKEVRRDWAGDYNASTDSAESGPEPGSDDVLRFSKYWLSAEKIS